MTDDAVPLETLVGALDIVGRLKGIERALLALSDAIANLQIMVTAMEIARVASAPLPPPIPPYQHLGNSNIYTFPVC